MQMLAVKMNGLIQMLFNIQYKKKIMSKWSHYFNLSQTFKTLGFGCFNG